MHGEAGQKRGMVRDLGSLHYAEVKDGHPIEDDMVHKDGTTDHSTDALRYWAVGMWLTKRKLRSLEEDSRLRAYLTKNKTGYSSAS